MKIEIPNDMLVVLILKGLPSSFENFRCAIRWKDDLPNTEVLIGKIFDKHRSRRATEPGDDNNALYAGNRYGRDRNRGKQKPKGSVRVVKQTTWRRNVNNVAVIPRKMSIQRERIFTLKSRNRKKSKMCHHQGDGVWIALAPCTCVPTKMQ